ncbi:Penicillin-binding protein 2 [Anaerotruncus sp. 2789STDY5834896]|uniref:Penicillin-binding protein 2 n=1 Tax=uncultured Anaerotruncus sp. TaxID=905011 RepID=A0A1C6K5Y2_9FIRM|nr:Penicillin-binding protein 2 [uncultured Anaerotruncus sp.]
MKPTKRMSTRTIIVLALTVVIGFGTVFANLINVQIVKGKKYSELAMEQQLRDTPISSVRGDITDCNGNILATSSTVWTVYISPADIKNDEQRELIAENLASILELDKDAILEKTKKKNYYEIIKRRVEKEPVDKVLAFSSEKEIAAIHVEEDTKRYYPQGNFLSSVLGFVGNDNQGLEGLEAYYDSYLSGTPGRSVAIKNSWGLDMPFDYEKEYAAKDGDTLVLTIDEVLQHYLEKYLQEAVDEHNATKRGAGIVMNVKTGEILAMATKPDYDPNEPFEIYDPEAKARIEALSGEEKEKAEAEELSLQRRNKVISDLYYPGSVFKPITVSAALEEGVVNANSGFYCPGYEIVDGQRINCASVGSGGHGQQNLMEILKNSCNPGLMQTAAKLGKEKFYQYFQGFGLTEKTGIDLPGEAQSIYAGLDKLYPVGLATSSFGQTNKITPLQMATAFSAVVNGGYLYQPHIVKKIVDADGNVVENFQPKLVRQVISEETSKEVAEFLEHVVADPDGQAKRAYVKGYRIGGKSGTSQKIDEEGGETRYIASFCAFAPVDDPQIVCLMFLDEADSYSIYGSTLMGPAVGKFMADALPYLGIEPTYEKGDEGIEQSVPALAGQEIGTAESTLMSSGFKVNRVGSGTTVVSQYPNSGQKVPTGSTITLYTESDTSQQMVQVPSFIGYTPSVVQQMAASANLNIKETGGGSDASAAAANKQSIQPGEMVPAGTVITVEFYDNTVSGD